MTKMDDELISRVAALQTLRRLCDTADDNFAIMPEVFAALREIPAIDPVHTADGCYCWECEYWDIECSYCGEITSERGPGDFCSYGKLKETGGA